MQVSFRKKYGIVFLVLAILIAYGIVVVVSETPYRTANDDSAIYVTIAPVKVPCVEDFLQECFVVDGVVQDYRIDNFVFKEEYTYVVSLKKREGDAGFVVENIISEQEASQEEQNAILRRFGRLSERELALLDVRPPEVSIDAIDDTIDDTSLVLPDTVTPSGSDVRIVPLDERPQEVIVQRLNVAPYTVSCGSGYADECLSVDGKVFYGDIADFEYQEGYEYVIQVERTSLPATGVYSYRLIEVLSQELVDSIVF